MPIPIYQVDAFTHQPFKGNPAAVCLLDRSYPDEWMQGVATEMNLSETAFLLPEDEGYNLRWMTPKLEVKLCGHATLASAHILFETGELRANQTVHFHTQSGLLTARKDEERIELNFPTREVNPCEEPPGLLKALGVDAQFIGKKENTYLVEVKNEDMVRQAKPDFSLLLNLPVRSVILTSRANPGSYDFISRYFAPQVGINEDPVTGSAHCYLAPFWSARMGKTKLTAFQASSRGGELYVRLNGDRVHICGEAITIFKGELAV